MVWGGQTLSSIGSMTSGIGVAIWIYVESGSAAMLGVLAAVASAPFLLTSPLMPLVDRYPRRLVMIGADTVAASGALVALALASMGQLEEWHLVVAAFVGGLGSAFQFPAFQASIPALVEPAALGRANGLTQFGPAVGIVVGPALAAPLVAWKGIEAVLLVDVATFVIAVIATAASRFSDVVDDKQAGDDGSWRSAIDWLRSEGRPLLALLMTMAVTNLLLSVFNVAFLANATETGGVARAGIPAAVGGVTMIVSSLVLGKVGVPQNRIAALAAALGIAGFGTMVAGSRPSLAVVVVGVGIVLATAPVATAVVSTVFHENVPAAMHGRVFGLRAAIGHSLEPVGSLIAGLLIARLAEPAMRADGWGAESLGRFIGVGEHRGSAATLVIIGLLLLALAVSVFAALGRQTHLDSPAVASSDG